LRAASDAAGTKRRALCRRAPDLQGAAVQLKQASGDGQPETGPAELYRRLVTCLRELVENASITSGAMPVPVTAMYNVTASDATVAYALRDDEPE
jgi:hypothetical protein